MPLIKSQNVPSSITPFSMRDVESAAKAMLLRARQGAEKLLAEAQIEADVLKQAAKLHGRAEGREEGIVKGRQIGEKGGRQQAMDEAKQQLTTLAEALLNAVTELDAQRRALESDALREVVELSIAIARRVTKRQGQIDPAVLFENVQEAMKLVVHSSDVRIAIHSSQRKTLEASLPALKLRWPQLSHVELVEDDALSPGGCRIFTRQGQVDADLDAQLDRVVADLLPTTEEGRA